MLLAIDTATRVASVALFNADGVQAEATWHSHENHTVELMLQVVRLLGLAHVRKNELTAIGVALGPGSFTGLRVGMSVAKGLAYGFQIPLIGVPTLDVIAQAFAWQPLPFWVILAAGRGRFAVARYAARRAGVQRVSDYALVDAPGLIAIALRESSRTGKTRRALFCGDIDATLAQMLKECGDLRGMVASPAMNARRAGFLAELAWVRFRRGESDDVATLAPLYLPHAAVEGSAETKK